MNIKQKGLFEENLKDNLNVINDEKSNNILLSLIALNQVKGLGQSTLEYLYDINFLSEFPKSNINDFDIEKINTKTLNKEVFIKIFNGKEKYIDQSLEIISQLEKDEISFIPLNHKDYPDSLRKIQKIPRWIFIKGNKDLLKSSSNIAVVGSRDPSEEAIKLTKHISNKLSKKNFIIVSGLAKGIDQMAHNSVLENYSQAIGVLGQAIFNYKYKKNETQLMKDIIEYNGLIISEYLPDAFPSKQNFLRRNELIVALSKVVIPIELSSINSGTAATIRRANKMEIPVISLHVDKLKNRKSTLSETILLNLGCKIFYDHLDDNVNEFWDFLSSVYDDHDFNPKYENKRKRFFKKIGNFIEEYSDKVDLNENNIEELFDEIRKKIIKK